MKTKHIKITNRTARKLPFILAASLTRLLPALVLILTIESSFAGSATWDGSTGEWNLEDNWTPMTIPNGPADTATFEDSGEPDVFLSDNTEVNSIVFNSGADAFTITAGPGLTLIISGVGITNNSGMTQNFVIGNDGEFGVISFTNSATAGNLTSFSNDGQITFGDSATAGDATITNNSGGVTDFFDTSTAGDATITNNSGGVTDFGDTSTAGNATLIANGGSGGGVGGTILFEGESTGGTARVEVFGNGNLDISSHTAGVAIGSIEGSGAVFLGANNLTVGSNNLSTLFSGVIQGSADFLTKVGTGALTLSGTNTYTGLTTVSEGILNIQNDSALGATTSGTVVLSSATLQLQGGISVGAEALLIEGTGAAGQNGALVNVSGTNNYGGLLTLGSDSTISSDSGTLKLTNPGTIRGTENSPFDLTLTGAGDGTISSIIGSGTGTLTKSGAGTWTLNGVNTYTGLTTVTAGILAEGVSNAISTGDLTVNGATAIFDLGANHSDSVGTVTLDGGGGITGTGTSTLTSTGSFEMKSGTASAILNGSVALNKTTTGTVTLTGANTYTGPTTVDAGALLVDGSIGAGPTSVNAGGLLGGGGTIGGSVLNSGIVSPGHSPGTLTVGSTYTQTAGGTLRIEVAGLGATEHDLLVVNGSATLAGTLQVIRLNNFQFHVGDQITFLTAGGGVSGTFNPVENDFSISGTIVESQIVYLPNSVVLEETQGSFAAVCPNPNDIAVGIALDNAVGDPRASELIEFLNTVPLSDLCDALDLISPADVASIFNVGVSLANIQTANLQRRMDDIRAGSRGFSASGFSINGSTPNYSGGFAGPTGPEGKSGESIIQPTPDNRWGVFVTGLGEFTDVDDTGNAHGYDLSTGGLTVGVDYRVSPNFAIGLIGGYAHTDAGLANNGNLDVDGGKIGLYATAFGSGFYLDTAVTGGFNSYDTRRTALLGSAHGSTDGGDFTALVAGGYDWKKGGLSIGPVASLQYTYVGFDGFTESGSLAPLSFDDQNADSIRTAVGFKTAYDCKVGHVLVKPELRAAWQHEFGDRDYSLVSRFASGAGSSFTVNGPAIGRDSLLVGAGVAVLWNDRISTYAYYDGELGRTNYVSHNVSAGVRVTF